MVRRHDRCFRTGWRRQRSALPAIFFALEGMFVSLSVIHVLVEFTLPDTLPVAHLLSRRTRTSDGAVRNG